MTVAILSAEHEASWVVEPSGPAQWCWTYAVRMLLETAQVGGCVLRGIRHPWARGRADAAAGAGGLPPGRGAAGTCGRSGHGLGLRRNRIAGDHHCFSAVCAKKRW